MKKSVKYQIGMRIDGSLTIEAALGLSLFVFAVICLIMPVKMLDTQRRVQMTLEAFSKELSQYAYIQYRMSTGGEYGPEDGAKDAGGTQKTGGAQKTGGTQKTGESQKTGGTTGRHGPLEEPEELSDTVLSLFERGAAALYLRQKIETAVGNGSINALDFSQSELSRDGERIDLQVSYRMKLPFSIFTLDSVPARSRSLRRGWIGSAGGRHAGSEGGDEKELMVYVGNNRSRYHWFSDCHYISNNISAVSYEEAGRRLSAAGSHYKPCGVCKGKAGFGATVYILPNGKYYHSSANCSSLSFYVRKVPLKEVESLGECSYCRRKRGGT